MPSHRRFTIYFSWDKRKEASRPLEELNNRFPTLHELRRFAWPMLRNLRQGEQGIDAFLNRIVLQDFRMFVTILAEETGIEPIIADRVNLDGTEHSLVKALANGVDTLIVVSLDHFITQQVATTEELKAIDEFLSRSDSVLVVCPHHYVGGDNDNEDIDETGAAFHRRVEEHQHHADPLVPAIQRIGGYARSLLSGLGLPVENIYGLRPAVGLDGEPTPLMLDRSIDVEGFLGGKRAHSVSTFNAHPHLPHLQPVGPAITSYKVLAQQQISTISSPHPFPNAGVSQFNALLWAPPTGNRAGHVLVCDATLWSAAFKGLESLTKFWRNLASRPLESSR